MTTYCANKCKNCEYLKGILEYCEARNIIFYDKSKDLPYTGNPIDSNRIKRTHFITRFGEPVHFDNFRLSDNYKSWFKSPKSVKKGMWVQVSNGSERFWVELIGFKKMKSGQTFHIARVKNDLLRYIPYSYNDYICFPTAAILLVKN